ncbi:TonB-dependent siderophore receptor [Synechococcales cyanobacterium C]|uniref:TonB-dependent siderophore receptor n=1 Tax=Petrachloros mirabilis ULC683 TaxID=2781853 RepID=A0A8K1ZYW4_9CYAN|nr:TonB-dependent siderophore receptor [Petrachloros mirabilis]NCJ07709.1 TonB-dependent siderophore receptor [Petrachloros mirabilis ULC683]
MTQKRMGWGLLAGVVGMITVIEPLLVRANDDAPVLNSNDSFAGDLDSVATTVEEWLAQIAQARVQITGVQLDISESGLQVVLETAGELLTPTTRLLGNALIAEFPNAVLSLPEGDEFSQANPTEGIALVTVSNLPGDQVRVAITGTEAPPMATVSPGVQGLIFSVVPGTATAEADEEAIQVVVTGEQDEGYNPSSASTATRTDTPLRDIPQAIQVIPRQVIEDQGITRIEDALRNAVGVSQQVDRRSPAGSFAIRGFRSNGLRNGFEFIQSGQGRQTAIQLPNTIERVEVLRGPDSVLYGAGEPGGTVNYVTKQPLSEPYYGADFTVGQFSFYQPSLDLSGPLREDRSLLYRLTATYQNFGSFLDFVNGEAVSIAPIISYQISENTRLGFEYEYAYYSQTSNSGLPLDSVIFDLPRSRNYDFSNRPRNGENHALIFSLEHVLNESIRLKSAFRANFFNANDRSLGLFDFDANTNEIFLGYREGKDRRNTYSLQNSLTAQFNTGSVQHKLLFGVDWITGKSADSVTEFGTLTLNAFNPNFNQPFQFDQDFFFEREINTTEVGIYLQDQITLLSNLKLLIGGRYDFLTYNEEGFELFEGERTDFSASFSEQAFSPRVGIVYQPIEPISLYASYNQSFSPNNALTRNGDIIKPERGNQYEVGIRAEFGNLSANLAAYQITKTNVLRTDPNDPDFQIPIGEVRSRGLEFDIGGEILPGWNIIATAFLNDAVVTVGDESSPEGNTLINAPRHGVSLWSTYEIQQGSFQGFGLGTGLFYVGNRETQIPNNFVLPSYVRTDAVLFYRRDNWNVQLNFRNLFNTRYFEGNAGQLTTAGEPFTVQGKVSVQF